MITDYAKYYARELPRRHAADGVNRISRLRSKVYLAIYDALDAALDDRSPDQQAQAD